MPVFLLGLSERGTFLLSSIVSSRNTSSDVFSEYIDYFTTYVLLIQSSAQDSRNFSHERNVQNKLVFNMGIKNASAFLPHRPGCGASSLLRGCDPPEAPCVIMKKLLRNMRRST
jgi:hypothetical protein